MHVIELWRHPVKSLQGEALNEAEVVESGVRFDRAWGVRSETTGKILTGRRRSELLLAGAIVDGGEPWVTLPDGTEVAGTGPATDAVLSSWLGEPVALVHAAEVPPGTAEFFADATDDTSPMIEWTMPPGHFVDAMPLLVVTTASLRMAARHHPEGVWDARRFRPNVVVECDGTDWVEDGWIDQQLTLGDAVVVPRARCVRCTVVTRPQPGLERDLDIFRSLRDHHDSTFGVWCSVARPGTVRAGDTVTVG